LSPAELLSVSDHLAVCETCRQQIERTLNGDAAFLALHSELLGEVAEASSSPSTQTDPTSRELSEYVDEILAAEDLELVNAAGGKFGLAVDDLLEFRNRIASELGHSYAPLPARASSESWWHRLISYFRSRLR
jgi:hypothetical protein